MRSHYCGQLNLDQLAQTVTLCGWVNKRRDHGGVIFIDLRDRYGLAQVVFAPDNAAAFGVAEGVRNEYVLRVTGTVPSNNVDIPGILRRSSPVDASGHKLIDTYLNPTMAPRAKVIADATSALNSLLQPASTGIIATSGFFTVTMKWSGLGDVDLYTNEPGGSTVFFGSPQGASGKLDVDNTAGFGPEHYYASCNSADLVAGSYEVSVDNYSAPAGLTATLQVTSYSSGVLMTKTVNVSNTPSHGRSPVRALVVTVAKNATVRNIFLLTPCFYCPPYM